MIENRSKIPLQAKILFGYTMLMAVIISTVAIIINLQKVKLNSVM